MPTAQDLMVGLLDYVVEQAKEIDPHAFNLARHAELVIRPAALSGLPGVRFDVRDTDDAVWLRVERLEAKPAPQPSGVLSSLLAGGSDPAGAPPTLPTKALDQHLRTHQQPDQARAALLASFDDHLRLWLLWAESEKPRRQTMRIYADLFTLKHQMEAEETARPLELVWGVGVASWQIPVGEERVAFDYPLLTQALEILVEPKTMVLELRPRDVGTRVELDAVVACSVRGASEAERALRERVAASGVPVSPFDPGSYQPLLKLPASALDADGAYREVLARGESCPAPGPHLVVSDAWVILARPRTNNYLLDDIRRLKARVEAGTPLPAGPLAIVSQPSDEVADQGGVHFRGLSGSTGSHAGGEVRELFFPLPYNQEQVAIVEKLERSPGVAVQGPPGTGKTHTIANIVCHFLATGRRVLITSRGEPALAVLQEKIPEAVRPLTVALLSGDREGIRQFQEAIAAIQHRISQLNTGETAQTVAQIQSAIERSHRELIEIDRRVDAIAQAQLSEIVVDGVPLRAQKAAELVVRDADAYRWFDDELTLDEANAPPMSDRSGTELREARRRLGEDLVYLDARLPSPDALPSVPQLSELHRLLTNLAALTAESEAAPAYELKATTGEVLAAAEALLPLLESARSMAAEVERDARGWGVRLRERCRDNSFEAERKALEAVFEELGRLTAARADFLQRPVAFPAEAMTDPKTLAAVQKAAATGKPFGLMAFGAGDAKAHVAAVRVSGLAPTDANAWAHVARHLQLHQSVLSFETRWNAFARDLGVPLLSGGVESLRNTEAIALAARKAHRLGTVVDRTLLAKGEAVFATVPEGDLLGGAEALNKVSQGLRRHLTRAGLAKAAVGRAALDELLAGATGTVSSDLRAFVAEQLGQPTVSEAALSAGYAGLMAELRRVVGLSADLGVVREAAQRVRAAGAARWADRLTAMAAPRVGDDAVVPPGWRQAWTWARLRGHLDCIDARTELRELANRREELSSSLARNYGDVVAHSAWLATKKSATGRVLQALAGYATAIGRIGKGTGPNAIRYRRDARDAMLHAAGAVPCWIMSHARVSEAMPSDIGAFDLVIVDEASQSDLWALPAVLRGKKILVVGDDKQVSPDGGFISAEHVDALRKRFLHDQPYGASMTPGLSLYDLAARVFAAHQVMLREHFRCVEPIIAYSRRVFYGNGIQPLRTPKASERLDPPLVDIYIPDGYRSDKATNLAEAEVIADEIEAILENPAFEGRTLGAVSLQGIEQAKLIDEIVRSRCSPAELLDRKFEAGDARTFQGSERDIMFLSLVADRDNHHALSGIKFDQRFNVAASRARDRMVLVRSVELKDLSALDLRCGLLEHFEKPMGGTAVVSNLAALCESGFEREVFARLTQAGYRTVPQVKVGSYRIDLVVEGEHDRRLAIELDGDDHHGPDRWAHDMARQRVLERAGWEFWRCFASTWSLHKDAVFLELTTKLAGLGIEPLGAMTYIPSVVERRVRQKKTQDADAPVPADAVSG